MTTKMTYEAILDNSKQIELNRLIKKYDGFPVGTGYIDIIVLRDRYVDFINELTKNDFAIEAISWWCHATEENKLNQGCPHGYGGPETKFGWFSEMCHDFDEIEEEEIQHLDNSFDHLIIEKINSKAISIIQNKQTVRQGNGRHLTFKKNKCLTPGIWIYVPSDWTRAVK